MWLIEIVSTEGFTPSWCGQFVDKIFAPTELTALSFADIAKNRLKMKKAEAVLTDGPIHGPSEPCALLDVSRSFTKDVVSSQKKTDRVVGQLLTDRFTSSSARLNSYFGEEWLCELRWRPADRRCSCFAPNR